MSSPGGTDQRILDAAFACAQRAADFTMADVAQAAGLSRQAVYLHFPDRAALLAALLARLDAGQPSPPDTAPSARAGLSALVARLADAYPARWPVARALGGDVADPALAEACRALAQRFREEGALSPHLSPATAQDLLSTLLSLAVWKELVVTRGWDAGRYRSHVVYLAVGAITK